MPEKRRCDWGQGNGLMQAYHDEEWGVPLHDDQALFEFLVLEGAQAGLSWQTVLNKRENYRKAFDNFDIAKVARYTPKRIEKLLVQVTKPTPHVDDDKAELAVLERVREALEQARPARAAGISKDDERRVRSFQFLTLKPEMGVFNAGENAKGDETDWAEIAGEGVPYLALCASLEMEVGQLPEADRAAFIEELGMGEPASARFLRASYGLLGLQSFFTVGEDEVRAWTLAIGGTAEDAAGTIHSDLKRGFVRAEVMTYDDLIEHGSEKAVTDAGSFRLERRPDGVAAGAPPLIGFSENSVMASNGGQAKVPIVTFAEGMQKGDSYRYLIGGYISADHGDLKGPYQATATLYAICQ